MTRCFQNAVGCFRCFLCRSIVNFRRRSVNFCACCLVNFCRHLMCWCCSGCERLRDGCQLVCGRPYRVGRAWSWHEKTVSELVSTRSACSSPTCALTLRIETTSGTVLKVTVCEGT
eukprot:1897740-Rhodomonas_salina.1